MPQVATTVEFSDAEIRNELLIVAKQKAANSSGKIDFLHSGPPDDPVPGQLVAIFVPVQFNEVEIRNIIVEAAKRQLSNPVLGGSQVVLERDAKKGLLSAKVSFNGAVKK